MRHPALVLCVWSFLLVTALPATGQDFGNFLKNAARDALRDQIAPPPRPRSEPRQPGQGQPQPPGYAPATGPGQPMAPGYRPARPPASAPAQGPASLLGQFLPGAQGPQQAQKYGEPYTVKTADGWTLVAHRYRPTAAPKAGAAPVILCHGLTYNAMFWELDPSCSLATYLAAMGYDVWAVDLRGCGLSEKWVWKVEDAPVAFLSEAIRKASKGKIPTNGYATINPKFSNWNLDHHIAYDVPAFVNLVRKETRANDVTWVGHSMGGIVALGHLSRYQNPGIGRLVTVGSQVTMPQGQIILQFCREMLVTRQGQILGEIRGDQLISESKTSVDNMFFNERNALPHVYEALSTWAKDVPSMGLLQQYMELGKTGELTDAKKAFNYTRNIKNINVPVLISCGADDQFAPPAVQKYLYDNIGSPDKTVVVFGRRSGFSVDAGHDDSLVGLNSRQEVYPWIERWIAGGRDLPGTTTVPRTAQGAGVIAR